VSVPAGHSQRVEVDGRHLTLSNLEKVLYPETGTTKAEVLTYLTAVAPAFLAHLRDRPVTRKRWPDGVAAEGFFEKNAPRGVPSWVRTVTLPTPGSSKGNETIDFVLVEDLPALVWAGNMAALELHVPQWTVGPRGGVHLPDRLVFDLDPGAPAGLPECARVALAVRDRLAADGLEAVPVTSGGKGMQLYAAVSGRQDSNVLSGYARALAQDLERELPRLVVSRMAKTLRPGRVLLDWSQNNAAKTTICPYSPRGRELPRVAAPRTWEEVEQGAERGGSLRQLGFEEVVERLGAHGDLAGGLLEGGPRVPT
jgi:bifunctional non-homologous end joining protein LigD